MKPQFRAESVGAIGCFEGMEKEGLEILDICRERPLSINPVLDALRDRRLEVIQDEMSEIVSRS